jgi:hypothetical protein
MDSFCPMVLGMLAGMLKKRVTLEPELEVVAGHLDAFDRLQMAAKLARWAHQLRVSARVLRQPTSTRQKRPRLPPELARLN